MKCARFSDNGFCEYSVNFSTEAFQKLIVRICLLFLLILKTYLLELCAEPCLLHIKIDQANLFVSGMTHKERPLRPSHTMMLFVGRAHAKCPMWQTRYVPSRSVSTGEQGDFAPPMLVRKGCFRRCTSTSALPSSSLRYSSTNRIGESFHA